MKRLTLSFFCLCLLAAGARAQNWPQFRGPQASGVAEGQRTPVNWDATKSAGVLWKTPIPGLSHASPVVWGDRVFVVTAESADPAPTYVPKDRGISPARDEVRHSWRVYALDKKTGRVLWQQTAYEGVPRARRHIKATQANSTPATDGSGGKLYLSSEDGDVYVVRAGPRFELLATNPVGEPLMATPAITDGMLIIRAQRHVYAVGEKK